MIDFKPLQKLPKNVGDLGKFIAAKGFKKLPKVQKIAKSGHTGSKKANDRRGAAIALWIRLRLPSCDTEFEYHAHHLGYHL